MFVIMLTKPLIPLLNPYKGLRRAEHVPYKLKGFPGVF